MKNSLLALLLVVGSFQLLQSKPISTTTAGLVASNFFTHVSGRQPATVVLSYTEKSGELVTVYAFTIDSARGFVLIAADDRSTPILGYSIGNPFIVPTDGRVGVRNWLAKYSNEISYIVAKDLKADNSISTLWQENLSGEYASSSNKQTPQSTTAVAPLLPCTWDQAPFYNDACPYDSLAKDRTVTGCPATAMAQIMKKWAYPQIGSGKHEYKTAKYGTLSADFGGSVYNWSNMPNKLDSANSLVAQLMYHMGVSTEMAYGTAASGGSGAYVIASASPSVHCSEYAFKTYFRYDSTTLRGLSRSDFSDSAWTAMLKADLDAGRPSQYAGYGPGGGHTWVCDGYDVSGMFHMNWGWGGSDNAYFTLAALNPGTLGTGGGDGAFNGNQQALIGIQPTPPLTTGRIQALTLADSIRVSPNPVAFQSPFSVTVKLTNSTQNAFSGKLAASLFDANGKYIQDVQVLSNNPIASGATSGTLTFTTTGIPALTGNLIVGIYESTNGRDWVVVGSGSFPGSDHFVISEPTGAIQLASGIDISPKQWVENAPVSVSVNVKNNSAAIFKGQLSADLYDLDGNFIENVGSYSETAGLAAGASYPTPITISTSALQSQTGSYILAISYASTTDTGLCGGQLHPNPVYIDIDAPTLAPDSFEPNNSAATASTLTPMFTNGHALISTTGSNINIGTDNDYYKVDFPTGFSYTIRPLLHDSYTDPKLYTVDAGFSIKDGGVWSDTYDDTVFTPISLTNGGSLMFRVATFFAGKTGTYLLTIDATQGVAGVAETAIVKNSAVYPNPASNAIIVNSNPKGSAWSSLRITNLLGQTVKSVTQNSLLTNGSKLDVSDLREGVYFVTLRSGNDFTTSKLMIAR